MRHIFWYKIVLWKTLGGQVSVDRTVLENMVFRCFYGFLASCKLIFVKKNGIYIKTNIRFGISMKNWVDWDMFQSFETILIFFENLPVLPLRVPSKSHQNMLSLKIGLPSSNFSSFYSQYRFQSSRTLFHSANGIFEKSHILIVIRGYPEGEYG